MADSEDKKDKKQAAETEAKAEENEAKAADVKAEEAGDAKAEAEAAAEPEAEAEEVEAAESEEELEAAAEEKPKKAARKPAKKAAPKKKAKKKAAAKRTDINVPEVKALSGKDVKFSPDVFEVEPKVGVLHEVVRAEMAARRRGTASSKTRSEVSGGGVKPWRQKGTGRARAGSSRMPHWTGGGITFGPTPRDYSFKVNRKVRSKALKMALSARVSDGGLQVVDKLSFETPQTAAAAAVLKSLDVAYPLLVLLSEGDDNAALSFRNIPRVDVRDTSDLDVSDVIGARTVLVTSQALDVLNRLGESK